jgi:hypothetical protein
MPTQPRSSQLAGEGEQVAPGQGSPQGSWPRIASQAGQWGGQSSGGATAKVAFFTGAYITVVGVALLLFPQLLFALLFPAR